jgi:UPF0042 nucleotide-binding protein
MSEADRRRAVVLVSGLSGAGKSSIMHALEDLGYEAVDNPPLPMLEELVAQAGCGGARRLAVGVDARTLGFDAEAVLATLQRLRANPALRTELVFAWCDDAVLLRRYTESRRRHPLAPTGRVIDGIIAEHMLTAPLREAADLALDTTEVTLPELRRRIELRFAGGGQTGERPPEMAITLVSFAFPVGLPRDADMVFDARFLRNPHYVPALRYRTGLQPEVAEYIEADPDFPAFFKHLADLLGLVLPRFVQEGKKYATIAVGCTGGQHRSVHIVERLAALLTHNCWRVGTTHRELAREGASGRPAVFVPASGSPAGGAAASLQQRPATTATVQAQEA